MTRRSYTSELRSRQAAETRERILDAATQLLGEGAHRLTIPNVARGAGVAVPTVYRHFPTKEDLEDGIGQHVRKARVGKEFHGLEGLLRVTRENWDGAADLPNGTLAVLLATNVRDIGRSQEHRRSYLETHLGPDLDGLLLEDREHFLDVVQSIASGPAAVAFLRACGSAERAHDAASWMLRTLHETLKARANG